MDPEQRDPDITPALIPIRTGIIIMVALVVLSLVSGLLDWPVFGFFVGLAIVWGLFFGIGTPYAFHKARQAGEWPPKK